MMSNLNYVPLIFLSEDSLEESFSIKLSWASEIIDQSLDFSSFSTGNIGRSGIISEK